MADLLELLKLEGLAGALQGFSKWQFLSAAAAGFSELTTATRRNNLYLLRMPWIGSGEAPCF
jgi:hypothetical protein